MVVGTGENIVNIKSLKKEWKIKCYNLRKGSTRVTVSGERAASGSFLDLLSFSNQATDSYSIKVHFTCHLIPLSCCCNWQFHHNREWVHTFVILAVLLMVNVTWEGPQGTFALNRRPPILQWHALSWEYCFSTVIFDMADPFLFQPSLPPPLSEIGFGCSPIYYIIFSLYFIFTLSSTFIKNATTLVVICMVTGLSSSAPMCNVVRTIADVPEIENCGVPMAISSGTILYVVFIISIVKLFWTLNYPSLAPCIGPMIGAWIGQSKGVLGFKLRTGHWNYF